MACYYTITNAIDCQSKLKMAGHTYFSWFLGFFSIFSLNWHYSGMLKLEEISLWALDMFLHTSEGRFTQMLESQQYLSKKSKIFKFGRKLRTFLLRGVGTGVSVRSFTNVYGPLLWLGKDPFLREEQKWPFAKIFSL